MGLQKRIEDTLMQMEEDVFAASLSTDKLSGTLEGLRACSCGYDCRIVFSQVLRAGQAQQKRIGRSI